MLKSTFSYFWSTIVFVAMLGIAGLFLYATPTVFEKNGAVAGAAAVLAAFGAFAFAIRFLPAIGKGIGALRRLTRGR